jgi:hypothetical protein
MRSALFAACAWRVVLVRWFGRDCLLSVGLVWRAPDRDLLPQIDVNDSKACVSTHDDTSARRFSRFSSIHAAASLGLIRKSLTFRNIQVIPGKATRVRATFEVIGSNRALPPGPECIAGEPGCEVPP